MSWQVLEADCVEAMKDMDEASVDAIVTDPPYGLGFMGKDWDSFDRDAVEASWSSRGRNDSVKTGAMEGRGGLENFRHSPSRTGYKQPNPRCGKCGRAINGRDTPKGFKVCHCDEPERIPQPNRDAQRSQQWHQAWATEALRVLKPGGFLLAFGGTRTAHRLACAIEDAGFEIRDRILCLRGGDAVELGAELDWLYGSG